MILVTGGAGYIGAHTVRALLRAGYQPVIFDDFSTGSREVVRGVPVVEGDIRRPVEVDAAFTKFSIESVAHFAGKTLVAESHESPDLYYESNVGGSLNLLDAMRRAGVRNLIFSSTCAIYGNPETPILSEDHPQRPINPYGETKLAVERAIEWFGRAYGIRYLSLRYFNAAGAAADGSLGENHVPETHLIPLVLEAAAGLRPEIRIYGTDYPTPDGTCIRDYVHVSDLADAHVMGLTALEEGAVTSESLNLGTGTGISIREVVATARRVTGCEFRVAKAERRPGDPARLVASAERAAALLGWTPRHSDLARIVESAWRSLQLRLRDKVEEAYETP
jgi:UDP-glucose-4-epimerase GalE